MKFLGDLYDFAVQRRQEKWLWNNGQPLVSAKNAEFVSLYCAPKWASKVHELDMGFQGSDHTNKLPAKLSMAVCQPFWEAMLRSHWPAHAPYFHRIFAAAAAQGNLTVFQAAVNVLGHPKTMFLVDTPGRLVHPRVLGWQHEQGFRTVI